MSILEDAQHIVSGERAGDYGENSLPAIARLWSEHVGKEITARDVAWMMVLLKSVRDRHKVKRDNLVDAVGYLQLAEVNAPDPTASRVEVCEWKASDLLVEAVKDAPVHPHTYDRLGEDEQIKGAVYKDNDGAFWTWTGVEWNYFDPDHEEWGWCNMVNPDSRYTPYERTGFEPEDIA